MFAPVVDKRAQSQNGVKNRDDKEKLKTNVVSTHHT